MFKVGPTNWEKDAVPCLTANFRDASSGEVVKLELRPLEGDKGYGLNFLPFLDATLVEGSGAGRPTLDAEEYRKATRKMSATGMWPNNSNPSNLLNKLHKFNGGTSTYTRENLKRQSWYSMVEAVAPPRSGTA